jgi:hypothetical protein
LALQLVPRVDDPSGQGSRSHCSSLRKRRWPRDNGLAQSGSRLQHRQQQPGLVMTSISQTSTADLKSLTHLRENRVQGLQIESGTGIMDFLVPMTFRSS